jgi:branched-subunit amino acid transport protein
MIFQTSAYHETQHERHRMNDLLIVSGMALVTFLVRYPLLVLVGKITLPEVVRRALRYVPLAVLAAIITPAIFMPAGEIDLAPTSAPLMAGLIAILVAWRTKNLLLTILIGMAALLIWRALFPAL